MGRLRVGLLRGEGELSEAEKKGLRSFSSAPTGLRASGSTGDGRCGRDIDRVKEQREVNTEVTEGATQKRKKEAH